MAQISYRANLSAAIFPMTIARAGRSVIIPGPDQNFNRSIDSPSDLNRDAGVPQIIYGENILPTADGFQSVGYLLHNFQLPYAYMYIVEIAAAGYTDPEVLAITSTLSGVGTLEVWRYTYTGWIKLTLAVPGAIPNVNLNVSFAVVRGVVYIYIAGSVYTYNVNTATLTNISATILPAGILTNSVGICGAYNYLILLKYASNDTTVFWSSTTTPTDFTPSLVSGAGSGSVANAQGTPICLKQSPEGFNLYTTENVINVTYTGNARYPWRFNPVLNSSGVATDSRTIFAFGDSYPQYAVTRSKSILAIAGTKVEQLAPEVTEFLERTDTQDYFNYSNNTFSLVPGFQSFDTSALYVLNSRYIFLSVPDVSNTTTTFGYVIVYDNLLQRYGKLKVPHTNIVTLRGGTLDLNKMPIGFIDARNRQTRLIYLNLDLSGSYVPEFTWQPMAGVLLLGKFQYIRARDICLDEIAVESAQNYSIVPTTNFSLFTLPTRDGKTFLTPQSPYPNSTMSTGTVLTYWSSTEGKNVSVLAKGAFDLSSVQLKFHLGGAE